MPRGRIAGQSTEGRLQDRYIARSEDISIQLNSAERERQVGPIDLPCHEVGLPKSDVQTPTKAVFWEGRRCICPND